MSQFDTDEVSFWLKFFILTMIKLYNAKKFCKDDISLIENYDKAIADTTQVWHCHHRRETIYSRSGLIEIGEYYNRPACELIFLTKSEHMKLHRLGNKVSAETRKKMSEANKGKHLAEETRKKLSEAMNGENNPRFGKPAWNKGKHNSEETRKKIGEARKGNHWYNNGVTSILAKTCPEGFVPGRIK